VNPLIVDLEEVAFRAWPAEEVREHHGWRLRYTGGVTRRANSVWPNLVTGTESLPERVHAVESFYRERGAPSSFLVSNAAQPLGLDAYLGERGYAVEAPVSVQTLAISEFHFPGQPPKIMTRVLPSPDEDWFHVSVERGRFAGKREIYDRLLQRIGPSAGFAVARQAGKPMAIGLGVVEGEWLGVFNMATLPEDRRQQAATAILGALVSWGSTRGATRAYLLVEEANAPARALYGASGFSHEYAYHYRTRP
jgi:GNAT superfamily N-acetyltransferase